MPRVTGGQTSFGPSGDLDGEAPVTEVDLGFAQWFGFSPKGRAALGSSDSCRVQLFQGDALHPDWVIQLPHLGNRLPRIAGGGLVILEEITRTRVWNAACSSRETSR